MCTELYRTENCLITLNSDIPALELLGKGYSSSARLRTSCNQVAPLLAKNGLTKLLVDVQDMLMVGLNDQIWAVTAWIPALLKAGLTAVAIISSKHYFHRMAVEAIVRRLDPEKLNIRYFDHKDAAAAWLKSLPS